MARSSVSEGMRRMEEELRAGDFDEFENVPLRAGSTEISDRSFGGERKEFDDENVRECDDSNVPLIDGETANGENRNEFANLSPEENSEGVNDESDRPHYKGVVSRSQMPEELTGDGIIPGLSTQVDREVALGCSVSTQNLSNANNGFPRCAGLNRGARNDSVHYIDDLLQNLATQSFVNPWISDMEESPTGLSWKSLEISATPSLPIRVGRVIYKEIKAMLAPTACVSFIIVPTLLFVKNNLPDIPFFALLGFGVLLSAVLVFCVRYTGRVLRKICRPREATASRREGSRAGSVSGNSATGRRPPSSCNNLLPSSELPSSPTSRQELGTSTSSI